MELLFNDYFESKSPTCLICKCIPSTNTVDTSQVLVSSRALKDGRFGYRERRKEGIPGGAVVWAKAQR